MSTQKIIDYYEKYIDDQYKLLNLEETMGIHYGYQENGVRTYEEAVLNMNYHVGNLMDLNILNEQPNKCNILDAGCGVGGTSITLAKKYPNINFTGITISPQQIEIANDAPLGSASVTVTYPGGAVTGLDEFEVLEN